MKTITQTLLALALRATVSLAACDNVITPSHQTPALGPGWQGQLIANGFTKPRTIHFDTAGSLIVLDSGVGVRRVRLDDNGGTCLSVEENELLIDDTELNHGLAFSSDGRTLYASTVESVYAWSYDPESGTVGRDRRVLITGMSNNDHTTRTLLMSQRSDGLLIVSRGSDENFDIDALDVSSGVSQIRVFDLKRLADDDTYDFSTQGRVLGWGLRNSVGLGEDPATGYLYSVETSVDGITRDGVSVEANNPAEELNFHGRADEPGDVGNYGYPYCYPVWGTADLPGGESLRAGDVISVSQNATFNDTTCRDEYVAPRLVFPAHTSPLDLLFSEDGETLYISFRGSFNPDNPAGYMVSTVAFSDGQPVDRASSTTALTDIMTNPDHSLCPADCFRPVGLAWDSRGRLWVTSDNTGEIYVLRRAEGDEETGFVTESGGSGRGLGVGGGVGVALAVGFAGLFAW